VALPKIADSSYLPDWWYVVSAPKFIYPAKVEVLSGDASKAKKVLGWRRRYNFEDLAKEMTAYDWA
jgi:GDPmannose 4,6-dehydratase